MAASIRAAARLWSSAARACRTAGTGWPSCSYQRLARPCSSATDGLSGSVSQARAQDVGEQVVVAVPAATGVQRYDEQVLLSRSRSSVGHWQSVR